MDPVGGMRWNKGYKEYFTSRFQRGNELFHPKKGSGKNDVAP